MSLALRAVLAVVLLIGFYVLAIGIALGLAAIPVLEVVLAERLHFQLAFICVASAFAILWAILPRIDRFEPPGPELTADREPRLFAVVEEIAAATEQRMPREVYLVPDVNAFVASRGGVMGIGSRRVMGIGLPLLQALTVSQLRAVLAHEFGHYYGGDTSLGPWIYKTRAAIGRTVASLEDSLLQKPFLWYGTAFLRITQAISRRQELSADALAARTCGAQALASGLRSVHAAALAFDPYWENQAAAVLASGHRVPIAAGFARFMAGSQIAGQLKDAVNEEIKASKTDPYDTHPSLRDRLAALKDAPKEAPPAHDPLAITLLDDVARAEQRLLVHAFGKAKVGKLKDLSWEEAGPKVRLPMLREQVADHGKLISGITPASVPRRLGELKQIGKRLLGEVAGYLPAEAHESVGSSLIGAALCVALADAGHEIEWLPGEPTRMVRGGERLEPFEMLDKLKKGELDSGAWDAAMTAAGIADADLGNPEGAGASATEADA